MKKQQKNHSPDMAKIGQLYLSGGMWDGKQIVPAWWIDESTKEQSRWSKLAYGYLWWVIDEKQHAFAALGDGGNVIYVNAKKNMVVAITSLFVPDVKDRIEFIKECIEPMFED
jgi:CubicO group peptidase (beta-lactamase class C family)